MSTKPSRCGRRPSGSSARTISGRSLRRPAARWIPSAARRSRDRPTACRGSSRAFRAVRLTISVCWRGRRDMHDQLITGVNWSPGIVNPFRSLGYGRGLESLLAEKFAGPQEPVMILVHLACPRVTYTDRGKSAIVMNSTADADALLDAVTAVTRSWTRQRRAELRDRSREISRRDALTRRPRVTIKDAAWQVMGAAYRHASGQRHPARQRQADHVRRTARHPAPHQPRSARRRLFYADPSAGL